MIQYQVVSRIGSAAPVAVDWPYAFAEEADDAAARWNLHSAGARYSVEPIEAPVAKEQAAMALEAM